MNPRDLLGMSNMALEDCLPYLGGSMPVCRCLAGRVGRKHAVAPKNHNIARLAREPGIFVCARPAHARAGLAHQEHGMGGLHGSGHRHPVRAEVLLRRRQLRQRVCQ